MGLYSLATEKAVGGVANSAYSLAPKVDDRRRATFRLPCEKTYTPGHAKRVGVHETVV